jgi:hypothetical protein
VRVAVGLQELVDVDRAAAHVADDVGELRRAGDDDEAAAVVVVAAARTAPPRGAERDHREEGRRETARKHRAPVSG